MVGYEPPKGDLASVGLSPYHHTICDKESRTLHHVARTILPLLFDVDFFIFRFKTFDNKRWRWMKHVAPARLYLLMMYLLMMERQRNQSYSVDGFGAVIA